MEHEQDFVSDGGPVTSLGYGGSSSQWVDTPLYQTSHQSPSLGYSGFPFQSATVDPAYGGMLPPRTMSQQMQPLMMPQWPSMLANPAVYPQPMFSTAMLAVAGPPVATPVSAGSTGSIGFGRAHTTPRKTLTNADRKRMCEYAERNPNTKQTEIGALFGVERSTVSKVLRQREKFLDPDESASKGLKRPKGRSPDIEKALSNWVRNHRQQGLPLDDATIKEKARFFATSVGGTDAHRKANSATWIEKFKLRNNIGSGVRSSTASQNISEDLAVSNFESSGSSDPFTPASPESPARVVKTETTSLGLDEGPTKLDYTYRPYHATGNSSLSTIYSEPKRSFSESNISPRSPFIMPSSADAVVPFVPSQAKAPTHSQTGLYRSRSQNFAVLGNEPFSPPSSGSLTPKFLGASALEDIVGSSSALVDLDGQMSAPVSLAPSMLTTPGSSAISSLSSPPLPNNVFPVGTATDLNITYHSSPVMSARKGHQPVMPSQEDARRAMEVVMTFFQQQPSGFVEPQEYMSMGKLMEKLKLQSRRPSFETGGCFDLQRPGTGRPMTAELQSIPEGTM